MARKSWPGRINFSVTYFFFTDAESAKECFSKRRRSEDGEEGDRRKSGVHHHVTGMLANETPVRLHVTVTHQVGQRGRDVWWARRKTHRSLVLRSCT